MSAVVMGVGWAYITLMSGLILILGIAAGRAYHEKQVYKKLFLNQKVINNQNYEYWLNFFSRHGMIKEVRQGEDGEKIWVILTDLLQEHKKEVTVAILDFMGCKILDDWGDENVHDE